MEQLYSQLPNAMETGISSSCQGKWLKYRLFTFTIQILASQQQVLPSSEVFTLLHCFNNCGSALKYTSQQDDEFWSSQFQGQLGHGKSVKFLSNPTKLSSSLLPGMVISVSIGENTSAAVTGKNRWYYFFHLCECCSLLLIFYVHCHYVTQKKIDVYKVRKSSENSRIGNN